jgi:hypothetical protein
MLSVSMNYFIPGSTSHKTCGSFDSRVFFSLTIRLASRRALLPPRISFIIRSTITPFASATKNIKGLNIQALHQRQGEMSEIVPRSPLRHPVSREDDAGWNEG